jgi:hypothetical protein
MKIYNLDSIVEDFITVDLSKYGLNSSMCCDKKFKAFFVYFIGNKETTSFFKWTPTENNPSAFQIRTVTGDGAIDKNAYICKVAGKNQLLIKGISTNQLLLSGVGVVDFENCYVSI